MSPAPIGVTDLGRRPYAGVLELQRHLCLARAAGEYPQDALLLVEHDPVYTLGRGTKPESLPVPPAELAARGTAVVEIERGGDVTWHGPGQLVAYPILRLSDWREDLHWYLRELEQVTIDALGQLGLPAERRPGFTGVWTGARKIASIGVHVKRWVTMHGLALNVTNDLAPFGAIVPCGIAGVEMTSVARELGTTPSEAAALGARARSALVLAFLGRFERRGVDVPAADLERGLAAEARAT